MNDKGWTPFINFKGSSHNPDKPDVLELQVADPEIFSTLYSDNVKVYEKDFDGNWNERILPLRNKESKNFTLFKQWSNAFHKGLINANTHLRIMFWMRKSKRNPERQIRDFKLVVLG